jgi:hypothetical protein
MIDERENARKVAEARVLKAERTYISEQVRKARLGKDITSSPWCGLGLSGGGIRSASLALGVMQALAEHNLLRRFDYISTVSGGGFIGASLQWWLRSLREDKVSKLPPEKCAEQPVSEAAVEDEPAASGADDGKSESLTFGLGPDDFPYGPAHAFQADDKTPPAKAQAQRNLEFLRAHSAYLIAGNGINAWSMAGVVMRTVFVSLLIWMPLLTGIAALIFIFDRMVLTDLARAVGLASPVGELATTSWSADVCTSTGMECALRYPPFYAALFYIFYFFVFLFISTAAVFAIVSRTSREHREGKKSVAYLLVATALVAALAIYIFVQHSSLDASLTLVLVACALFIAVAIATFIADWRTTPSLNASYILRRSFERFLGSMFIPTVTVFAVATIPLTAYYLHAALKAPGSVTLTGLAALFGGIASALYGYYTFLRSLAPSLAGQIAATAGAITYLYMTLVGAYVAAAIMIDTKQMEFIDGTLVDTVRITMIGLIVFALFLSLWANINYVGLHRFYRDRLMEAFMPSDDAVTRMATSFSPIADTLLMSDIHVAKGSKPGPYPLVNCNVIMLNDKGQPQASRGGDNFLISPMFVGSNATFWAETSQYMKSNGPISLASATAASGAAATANAGYIGTGLTMNPFVSAVMALLNVRLGLWIGNPGGKPNHHLRMIPTFLNPGLASGIFGRGHSSESDYIEITDGGHFENLALYELVRRKLEVILIVDGEADPKIGLAALVSAKRRVEEDHKARLEFIENRGPERLLMRPAEGMYPAGVKFATAPFVVGELTYEDGSTGTLIYIKSTLIREIDFVTAGYLAANPDFPHQSTVDQFFDPVQFDAYRYLGYAAAITTIKALELDSTIGVPAEIIKKYKAT